MEVSKHEPGRGPPTPQRRQFTAKHPRVEYPLHLRREWPTTSGRRLPPAALSCLRLPATRTAPDRVTAVQGLFSLRQVLGRWLLG
jgi:hypothetical protein